MTQFAQIEPTTRCNYTCGFCAGRSMRQGDLPWEAFERFLSALPDLRHVELQGEGEPLMHPRFFDMVAACRVRGIRVSLITNGSLLQQRNVHRLIEHSVESVHISLESADAVEFRSIRGGSFPRVVEGIRLLMERRRVLGRERPVVGFSVTVLRRTLAAIHEIAALYRELGLDGGISVQPLQEMPYYTERYPEAILREMVPHEVWHTQRPSMNAALATLRVQAGASTFYGSLFAGYDPDSGKCPWLESGAYLNIDGAVTGCCFIKNPQHAFGNVMTERMDVIAGRRGALARTLAGGVVPPACAGCGVANALTRTVRPARLRVVGT